LKTTCFIPAVLILLAGTAFGQGQPDTLKKAKRDLSGCEQQAIGDLFRKKDKAPKPPKNLSALILPNISSNPSNGFILGVGGSIGWYMGPKESTKVSSMNFTAAVTSKNQLITFIKSNIYNRDNNYFLQGDWRFYIYSQPTYGLGTNAPDTGYVPSGISWLGEGVGNDSVLFPMKFNYVKFHQIVNRRLLGELYAGLGYHLDYYYSIEDENYRMATDTAPEMQTPHHFYSARHEFSTEAYMLSGLSLNVVYDTRDNQISPYKGIYANINYRLNPTFLGSDQNSSSLWLEFRTYLGLSRKNPRHLIGFWAFGDFELHGKLPYLTLPYLGEDQRARSGRGYTNGRFRGDNMVYGEVEYRFPISPCSRILGGVLFVNAVTTSNPYPEYDVKLFEYIRPAVGFGIRVMVNKYFRTNINLDFAIGKQSKGFYFSGQETF
jgi:outer membrane protein assembly factor BamA